MNEPRPIFLSVVQAGTPEHPRFRVADCYLRYWSGQEWVDDETKGLLYASSNEACLEVNRLLMLNYCHLPMRCYRAPVYIDLFSDHEISRDQLIRWLVRVSKLVLDSQTYGNGPCRSLGSCRIEWGELEEVNGKQP